MKGGEYNMMKKVNPRIKWLFFSWWFFFWMLIEISDYYFENGTVFSLVVGLVMSVLFTYVFTSLTYRFYGYELTDKGFKVRLFFHKTVPYNRIKNVEVTQGFWIFGPIFKYLNLYCLFVYVSNKRPRIRIYSWGMSSLIGLDKEEAEKLRDELIKRAHLSKK